jgi:aminocarboxymuconate-semialdehyde decarboxylase
VGEERSERLGLRRRASGLQESGGLGRRRQCQASLEELSYALDVLGLDGFVLFTNSNGVYLGDPALEPVFEELERRKTVVYVHPNPSPDAIAHALGLPDNLLDFPTDTNRAVAQMHYTNRFARTPNVKYIFSHAGGSIPYLAARFAIIDEMGFITGGEQPGLIFFHRLRCGLLEGPETSTKY